MGESIQKMVVFTECNCEKTKHERERIAFCSFTTNQYHFLTNLALRINRSVLWELRIAGHRGAFVLRS